MEFKYLRNYKMALPKYKGVEIREVVKNNPEYFIWLRMNTNHTLSRSLSNQVCLKFCNHELFPSTKFVINGPRVSWVNCGGIGKAYEGAYPYTNRIRTFKFFSYQNEPRIIILDEQGYSWMISKGDDLKRLTPKEPVPQSIGSLKNCKVGDKLTLHDNLARLGCAKEAAKFEGQEVTVKSITHSGIILAEYRFGYVWQAKYFKYGSYRPKEALELYPTDGPPCSIGDEYSFKKGPRRKIVKIQKASNGQFAITHNSGVSYYRSSNFQEFTFYKNTTNEVSKTTATVRGSSFSETPHIPRRQTARVFQSPTDSQSPQAIRTRSRRVRYAPLGRVDL